MKRKTTVRDYMDSAVPPKIKGRKARPNSTFRGARRNKAKLVRKGNYSA